MSYRIVYDRQVIKTPTGYSFMVLSGDNNVYDQHGKYWRRSREWSCWVLNKSEQDVLNYFEKWCRNGCGEHFKWNGKFLGDDGLRRWVKSGLKNAKTIEDILLFTGNSSVHAVLSVWHNGADGCNHILNRYISTTDGFLQWCKEVKGYCEQHSKEASIYPVISVESGEPLCIDRCKRITGPVCLKSFGGKYVANVGNGGAWSELNSDFTRAIHFKSFEDAESVIRESNKRHLQREYRLYAVPATQQHKREIPKEYAIVVLFNDGRKGYISFVSRSRIRYCFSLKSAKRMTKAQANRSLNGLSNRHFPEKISFKIEKLSPNV